MPDTTRQAIIDLPIPGRAVLESFESVERLSHPFLITATVLCDDETDFFTHLGQGATITVQDDSGIQRYFHGLIFEVDYLDYSQAGYRYILILRPWTHFLTRNLEYKIYQDKNTIDIVTAVLNSRGFSDFQSDVNGSPPSRVYCVQYRETDHDFLSRLMEEDGIYYYFKHSEGRHVLVLCNGPSCHQAVTPASIPFNEKGGGASPFIERVTDWKERVSTGAEQKVTLRIYDFEKPDAPVEGSYSGGVETGSEKAEIYDFPANFLVSADGATLATTIMEADRRERRLYLGEAEAPALACGLTFTLEKHPVGRFNQEYLIVGLHYRIERQTFASGGGGGGASITLEATPKATTWRAPIVTPKPVARGPETALVTGPSGEVIYTDNYGRVKVQFYWDRLGQKDDKTTCWLRVSFSSAGQNFGHVVLPRVGQEVIVDFLNGDPDRPIVTGRVYNANQIADQTKPFDLGVASTSVKLPDSKTASIWRSQTVGDPGDYSGSEAGAPASPGYNEISMEDKGGSEALYIYAQRMRQAWVRLDDKLKVERDQIRTIRRDRTTNVKNNESLTVEEGDETRTIKTGKRTTQVQQNDTLEIIQGNMSTKVDQGNVSTDVAMGNYSIKMDMGSMTIEAMQSITLKVGQSSIVLNQQGVTIQGMMISVQAQVSLEAKGLMTDVEGSAMTTIKGGIVMIN